MTTSTIRVHPFFDELSEYRLATETCVWQDDGVETVREFFHDRAREQMLAKTRRDPSEPPPDLGLGSDLDRSLLGFLRQEQPSKDTASEPVAPSGPSEGPFSADQGAAIVLSSPPMRYIPALAISSDHDDEAVGTVALIPRKPAADRDVAGGVRDGAAAGAQYMIGALAPAWPSALLQVDLERPETLPLVRVEPRFMFPGIGPDQTADPMEQFYLNVPNLPPRRRCIAMILEHEVVETAAGELQPPDPAPTAAGLPTASTTLRNRKVRTQEEAKIAILEALRHETLAPPGPAPSEQRRRASRISILLSLVPTLGGATDETGRFQKRVPLDRPCPALDPGTWVVLCLGPGV